MLLLLLLVLVLVCYADLSAEQALVPTALLDEKATHRMGLGSLLHFLPLFCYRKKNKSREPRNSSTGTSAIDEWSLQCYKYAMGGD